MKTNGFFTNPVWILPVVFLFIIGQSVCVFASEARSELKDVAKQIKSEEAQLKKLRGEKKATAKRIALTESKMENYRRMLTVINKDIADTNTQIKEINKKIRSSEQNISKIKKDVARSNIFVIDNLGYSYIKIISTAKNPQGTVKTLEILSEATSALDGKVEELNLAVKELAVLKDEQKNRLENLDSMQKDKAEAVAALKKEQQEYSKELTLLKNDEAGRLEYLDMLNFRQQELNKKIKANSAKSYEKTDKDSSFGRSKGSLPWPIRGTVIEPFGERLIKEAGLKYFHKGWKIKPNTTSEIMCVAKGTVIFSDFMKGFGNVIVLSHGNSYYTVYGNMNYLNVVAVQDVFAGYSLGIIDVDQGNNTSYLYFEIRKNEQALDPSKWLSSSRR